MPRKGENIYKRKDRRWEARYIREHRADGTACYGYCYGKTYREAKQKVAEARIQQKSACRKSAKIQRKDFSCFCEEWLQLSRTRVKESTYVKYRSVIEKYIIPRFGSCTVDTISSVNIEQFGYDLMNKNGLSGKTVRDILTILHSVVQYAAKQILEPIPAVQIVYPKDEYKEIRYLSIEEQDQFVHYLLNDMDLQKFGTLLTLMTGLRLGELCALRWGNIFVEDQIIRVDSTMQRVRNYDTNAKTKTKIILSNPKSNTSARMIPLTEQASALCRCYQCSDPNAFVLTGRPDRYLEPRAMQYKLKRYAKECGLEGVHFHALRHTFATRCIEVEFEVKSLSEIMGHSSPRITLERYAHASLRLKRENMNKLSTVGL